MIGDDIGGSFASNSGVATFQDDFASYGDQTNADTNWPPVGTEIIVNIITDVIDWDFVRVNANRGVSFDLYQHGKFATPLPITGNWGLRWKMTQGSPQTMPSSASIEGYVGLYADTSSFGSGVVQDFIALRFSWTSANVKAIQLLAESVNAPENAVVQDTFTTVWNTSETQYFELKRTSATTMEATIYSDANYSVIVEKLKVTGISSAIDELRFIKVHNNDGSAVGGTFNGVIDDIEFFVNSEGLQDFFTAKGEEKTIDFDVFPDRLTGSNASDFVANFTSTTGWTSTDGGKVRIENEQDFLFIRSTVDNSNDSIANQILGGTVSDTAWVLRGSLNITDFISDNASQKVIFIGMWDTSQALGVGSNQDAIYLAIACDNSLGNNTGLAWIANVNNQVANNKAHDADFTYDVFNPMVEGRFFFELKRTSSTAVEATIYGDKGFTDVLQTIRATIPAGVTGLEYFKISNRIDVATGEIGATIDELEFWDGVTNVCTFSTAGVQENGNTDLNYCNENIFYPGTENNSNISISVDLTPSNISDSGFVIRCKIDVVNNNITASNAPLHWIGLWGSTAGAHGSVPQSGIALRIDPTTGDYAPSHGVLTVPATGWTVETAFTDLTITNGAFFLEISRLSTTRVRMSLYRDELFTDLIQSRTFAISSSLIDLRFWGIKNRVSTASTAFWEVVVTDVEVWDNENYADSFADHRMLETQVRCNQQGVIEANHIFNSDDQTNYSRRNALNGANTSVTAGERFLGLDVTNTDADNFAFLRIENRLGLNALTNQNNVKANAFGPANVPDRIEHNGLWRRTNEQVNKIEISNKEAGSYDTDSEIVVFGTD